MQIQNIRINYRITVALFILSLKDQVVQTASNFYHNFEENTTFESDASKSAIAAQIEMQFLHLVLAQFCQKNAMSQNPCSIILSIQGATDHSSLKNCSRSKSKSIYIVSLLLKIIYSIINYTTSRGFNRSIQPSF